MDLFRLRCFVVGARTLHFAKAAQDMNMAPAAFGRQIQLLERDLHVRLFTRSTRRVALSEAGQLLEPRARKLIDESDAITHMLRNLQQEGARALRVGAIDSAAAGLIPMLIRDLQHEGLPIEIALVEGKTIRLLPQLLNGSIDLAFVRPPDRMDRRIAEQMVVQEQPLLALPSGHPLANAPNIDMTMLRETPMILPSRRSRPHSHDLVVQLFAAAQVPLIVAVEAEEKHTILGLVAAGLGAAIVPRWSALTGLGGVTFRVIRDAQQSLLLSAVWIKDTHDDSRDQVLGLLRRKKEDYASTA